MSSFMRLVNWRPDPDGVWPLVREYSTERGAFLLAIAVPTLVLCIPSHKWLTLITVLVSLGIVGAQGLLDYIHLALANEELKNRRLEAEQMDDLIRLQSDVLRNSSEHISRVRAFLEGLIPSDNRPDNTDA